MSSSVVINNSFAITDPKRLTQLTEEIMAAFLNNSERNIMTTAKGIGMMVNTWNTRKAGLINTLRRHPNWDEEALAVVIPTMETRRSNAKAANIALNNLVIYGVVKPDKNLELWTSMVKLNPFKEPDISKKTADILNELFLAHGIKLGANFGQKTSRIVRKIMLIFGLDEKNKASSKLFLDYTNAINQLGYPVRFVLSVHPMDYLFMSRGNTWTSCHWFGGCYCTGVLSYMQDECSAVGYVIPSEKDATGNVPNQKLYMVKKWTRQMFMFNKGGGILQSRLYPDNSATETISKYGEIVSEIYGTVLGGKHVWKTDDRIEHLPDFFSNSRQGTHYPDWAFNYRCHTIVSDKYKDVPYSDRTICTIGAAPKCIICGNDHSGTSYYTCGANSCHSYDQKVTVETQLANINNPEWWGLPKD